ncbi:CapA family protein [Thermophilibacter sp.]
MSEHVTRSGVFSRRSFLRAALGAATLTLAGCSGAGAPAAESGARDRVTVYDEAAPDELEILMVGDVLVHQGVWQSGERADGTRNYDHLFARVADDVAAADVALVGQETILGGAELGLSGYPVFNSPQEIGDAEAAAGFDVALCASNHALDKGMAGIESELAFWRSAHPDMVVAGIADSEEASEAIPMLERAGHRIAVLNYAYGTNGIPLPQPWAVRLLDEATIAADAAAARDAGAEAIVACPHWGVEYAATPSDEQRHWAQVLADAGANVIIGGHPHVMQPFEVIEDADGRAVPVFWSVGNFTSTQPRKDTMVGAMARATLVFDDVGCEVASCRVTPLVTHRAPGTDFTTYRLGDYTEELAAANQIRTIGGQPDFSLQWCVDFCAERLGEAFDAASCELAWEA